MNDLLQIVTDLKRPKLLIQAARAGLVDYNRNRDLRRLTRASIVPNPQTAVAALLAEEDRLEETRRKGCANYSFTRHIEILIAMIAEARLLPKTAERSL